MSTLFPRWYNEVGLLEMIRKCLHSSYTWRDGDCVHFLNLTVSLQSGASRWSPPPLQPNCNFPWTRAAKTAPACTVLHSIKCLSSSFLSTILPDVYDEQSLWRLFTVVPVVCLGFSHWKSKNDAQKHIFQFYMHRLVLPRRHCDLSWYFKDW